MTRSPSSRRHKRARTLAVAVAACLSAARPARACATCGCGDPTLTAMGAEKPFEDRIRAALDVRFSGATTGAASDLETSWTLRSSLALSWSPTARFTLAALVPVLSIWDQTGSGPRQNLTGLGDAELSARGIVWQDRSFDPSQLVTLLGGVKLPTGPLLYDGSTPYPDDIQPGSGSFDPFAGAMYQWFGRRVSLLGSISFRETTSDLRGDAAVSGYRRGSSLGATAGAQYQPWPRLALAVFSDVRWSARDTLPGGGEDPDTGGTLLAVTPSIAVAPRTDWLVRVSAQIPVIEALDGQQWESPTVVLSTVVDLR